MQIGVRSPPSSLSFSFCTPHYVHWQEYLVLLPTIPLSAVAIVMWRLQGFVDELTTRVDAIHSQTTNHIPICWLQSIRVWRSWWTVSNKTGRPEGQPLFALTLLHGT